MPVSPETETQLEARMNALGIKEADLVEKFVRASGPGGQKVNKTSSAVYLKHLPSGIEVKAQEHRSQAMNRFFARRRILVERLPSASASVRRAPKSSASRRSADRSASAAVVRRRACLPTNVTTPLKKTHAAGRPTRPRALRKPPNRRVRACPRHRAADPVLPLAFRSAGAGPVPARARSPRA